MSTPSLGDQSPPRRLLLLLDGEFCEEDGRFAATRDRLHEFLTGLTEHDFIVTVASRCRQSQPGDVLLEQLVESDHIRFCPLPFYESSSSRYIRRQLPWDIGRRRIAEMIADHDIVIFRFNHAYARAISSNSRRLGKVAVCWWSGHPTEGLGGRTRWHRQIKRLVRRIEFIGMRRRSRRDFNIVLHSGYRSILPNGIRHTMIVPTLINQSDLQIDPPERDLGEPLRVMYAGRLTREKGVDRILLLWKKCRAEGMNVEFVVAGDGPLLSKVKQAVIHDSGLLYLGNLDSHALQIAMRSAHVMALLSDSEGMPKVVWEAWSAGLPILSTSVGGLKYVVRSDENGKLVDADDINGQFEFVRMLESDDSLRRDLGKCAIESVGSRTRDFQLELLANQLRSLTVK